jgi:hypothetical protein
MVFLLHVHKHHSEKTPKAKGQGNMRVDTFSPKLSLQHLYTHQYLLQKVSFENTSNRIHPTFMPACLKHPMVLLYSVVH